MNLKCVVSGPWYMHNVLRGISQNHRLMGGIFQNLHI